MAGWELQLAVLRPSAMVQARCPQISDSSQAVNRVLDKPVSLMAPTHQHVWQHQGGERPAVHSCVLDQHVEPLGLREAGHVQHHGTCSTGTVSSDCGLPHPAARRDPGSGHPMAAM